MKTIIENFADVNFVVCLFALKGLTHLLIAGVCISIHMNECVNVTSWSLTTFPNILGHTSPAQALDEANKYIELFYGPCAKDFWCTIWNPKCHHSKGQRPCRSYCQGMTVDNNSYHFW